MTRLERHSRLGLSDGGLVAIPSSKPRRETLPCIHLGKEPLRTQQCPTCRGNVSVKVFPCAVFGECVVSSKKLPDVAGACGTCTKYVAPPTCVSDEPPPPVDYGEVDKRHLIFHVYPVSGNGTWRRCVRELRLRWSLFTGRKVVSVVTGPPTKERIDPTEGLSLRTVRTLTVESVEAVRRELPSDAVVLSAPNDPRGWELPSWSLLWKEILSGAGDSDAVLYAHAKGVTRKVTSPVHRWTDLLYSCALDRWSETADVLRTKPVCGSLIKWGHFFGGVLSSSRWHYSGNVWWGRTGVLRDRLIRFPLPADPWAAEAWVGAAFHPSEAGVVYQPSCPFSHLYKPADCERVLSDYDHWCSIHPPEMRDLLAVSDRTLVARSVF